LGNIVLIAAPSISRTSLTSPWPHRVAVLLVCATFPLLWVGGLVTSTDSGMAVPDWPNTYGYNMFLYPWRTWFWGPWDIFVEHGHRMLGAAVGVLAILLVVAACLREPRVWVRWAAVGVLLLVSVQGVLGGTRVLRDSRPIAQLHACVGPLCFALCVALATITARWWSAAEPRTDSRASKIQRLAIATTAIAYLQLVLGSFLRHVTIDEAPSVFRLFVIFHLIVAAALVVHVFWLAARIGTGFRHEPLLWRPAVVLVALVIAQLGLGGVTWLTHYGPPTWLSQYDWAAGYTIQAGSLTQIHATTAHVAAGSLILVTALAIALRSCRLLRAAPAAARNGIVAARMPALEAVR